MMSEVPKVGGIEFHRNEVLVTFERQADAVLDCLPQFSNGSTHGDREPVIFGLDFTTSLPVGDKV